MTQLKNCGRLAGDEVAPSVHFLGHYGVTTVAGLKARRGVSGRAPGPGGAVMPGRVGSWRVNGGVVPSWKFGLGGSLLKWTKHLSVAGHGQKARRYVLNLKG